MDITVLYLAFMWSTVLYTHMRYPDVCIEWLNACIAMDRIIPYRR